MRAAANFAPDEAGIFQDFDMLGSRRERHRERLRKPPDGHLAIGKLAQHDPARRVSESVKDGVQARRLKFNHVVEYERTLADCQPIG